LAGRARAAKRLGQADRANGYGAVDLSQKEERMSGPWLAIAAIITVAVCYVLLPLGADTYRRFRGRKSLRCPETGSEAEVDLDAGRAALSSAFGRVLLRVRNCSLWPQRKACAQECVHVETERQEAVRPGAH
jgi:hypothetical protein